MSCNTYIQYITDFNECRPNPCENGGTCVTYKDSFTCKCPPKYKGIICQIGFYNIKCKLFTIYDFITKYYNIWKSTDVYHSLYNSSWFISGYYYVI